MILHGAIVLYESFNKQIAGYRMGVSDHRVGIGQLADDERGS